jgi:MoxR-like ATPase
MSIVEKLGITPGPWRADDYGTVWAGRAWVVDTSNDENSRLIAAAPELLEALIRRALDSEYLSYDDLEADIIIIERATGKSWEEVKNL